MAQAFGEWLVAQDGRPDWIGSLAKSAIADPGFPRAASIDQIRARMSQFEVETDMFEALDDAEREFLAVAECA